MDALPTLAKLPTLDTLPKAEHLVIARHGVAKPPLGPSELPFEEPPFDQKYAPYPPFNSSYEVYIWVWLNATGFQQAHQWRLQITFGRKQQKGSTRVDFLSDLLRIAWYPDGSFFHTEGEKRGEDQILRAQVFTRGYRVVQWILTSTEQLIKDLPDFYRSMVYGQVFYERS